MKNIFTYLAICISALTVFACSGTVDDGTDVPEGVLRIFADKTQIAADGSETVTFKAMYGSQDVSNARTFRLIRVYGDNADKKYMAYGANSFSTATPGKYTFTAEYYYNGTKRSDNSIVVNATEFFTGDEQEFEKRVLCLYFTSTTCSSCAGAAKNIKDLQAKYPGQISVVSLHRALADVDPMETVHTNSLVNQLGGDRGLPAIYLNMDEDTRVMNGDVETAYEKYVPAYEAFCGVSVDTEFDQASRELTVNLGVTSNLFVQYVYYVFLVEDEIDEYEQCGAYYVHQNVLRDLLTSAEGDYLNEGLPLSVGVEEKAQKKTVLSREWDEKNMRVIVAAAASMDNGETYIVNNVSECKVVDNE